MLLGYNGLEDELSEELAKKMRETSPTPPSFINEIHGYFNSFPFFNIKHMKVKDFLEKIRNYPPDLEISIEEDFDGVKILCEDWDLRIDKFCNPCEKPYYKLIIKPVIEGDSPFNIYKKFKLGGDPNEIIDELNKE